ncbi:hypothetical protein B0H14DRAFT_3522978 [Mycena olivaceomarginata]|nr:hypothetical protein B0H14DRAFT_3522978 [Mycena olivaceomarginata]
MRTQLPIAFVRTQTHPLIAMRASRPHVTWIVIRPHPCLLAGPHFPPRRCVFVGTQLHPPVTIVRTRTHPLVAIVRTRALLPIVFVDALPPPARRLCRATIPPAPRHFRANVPPPRHLDRHMAAPLCCGRPAFTPTSLCLCRHASPPTRRQSCTESQLNQRLDRVFSG